MDIQTKYKKDRFKIGDGCLVLISKPKFVSKVIRWHDRNEDGTKAEFSHIASVFVKEANDRRRLFILDSNAPGVKPRLLSDLMGKVDNYMFLKPLCSEDKIQESIFNSFGRAAEGIKYDFKNGLKEMFNRRYSTRFTIKQNMRRDICSEWVRNQAINQEMVTPEFLNIAEPFPQDYFRYMNTANVEIISYK